MENNAKKKKTPINKKQVKTVEDGLVPNKVLRGLIVFFKGVLDAE